MHAVYGYLRKHKHKAERKWVDRLVQSFSFGNTCEMIGKWQTRIQVKTTETVKKQNSKERSDSTVVDFVGNRVFVFKLGDCRYLPELVGSLAASGNIWHHSHCCFFKWIQQEGLLSGFFTIFTGLIWFWGLFSLEYGLDKSVLKEPWRRLQWAVLTGLND